MRKKIIIGILLLFLLIGVGYAAHNNEIFKAPNGLEPSGYNDFVDKRGHNIMIEEYNDENINTWFKNDTDPLYLIQESQEHPNIYIGATADESFLLEVVEKEDVKYIIGSWTPKSSSSDAKLIWENLQEFNKLNNLKPIEV